MPEPASTLVCLRDKRVQLMENATPEFMVFDREMKEERDFWLRKLRGRLSPSSLTPDYQRTQEGAGDCATLGFCLDKVLEEKLVRLTGSGPFLIYTAFMAALKLCLFRYTGNRTTVVGTPAR